MIRELLEAWPVDFMDGNPLRYRRGKDDRFLLYSVGTDFRDDGGINRVPEKLWASGPDDVWPRPAFPGEVALEVARRSRMPTSQTECRTFVPLR
jgi:hypothetical protein